MATTTTLRMGFKNQSGNKEFMNCMEGDEPLKENERVEKAWVFGAG